MGSHVSYKYNIVADYDSIWKALMDETENPHNYSHTIKDVEVLERFHNGVLRSVSVPDAEVREKVTYDYNKGIITSQLVGHPLLVGTIKKEIMNKATKQGPHQIECTVEWQSLDDDVNAMIRRNVESFVMERFDLVKKQAESQAK